ncbi:hypothetical protein BA896_012315 [Janthinobacterium lividum]|uniref:Integrase catalytic domain-containing protein n=1 Tax=Janthinobacterium lividum TaxID=29581 RepID=A0A1E8PTR2_9BURK|nr:hypothetical protein BA896_012315 [Janthinobacterium lividum]
MSAKSNIPGPWERDLIKGAGNCSLVGTLVERTTGIVVVAKMNNATTKAVVDSFSAVFDRKPAAMRKTMTYKQDREMRDQKILTERTGLQIYFADPHRPWQSESNDTANDLLRPYTPKGSDRRPTPKTSLTPLPCRSIPACWPGLDLNHPWSFILSTLHYYNTRRIL